MVISILHKCGHIVPVEFPDDMLAHEIDQDISDLGDKDCQFCEAKKLVDSSSTICRPSITDEQKKKYRFPSVSPYDYEYLYTYSCFEVYRIIPDGDDTIDIRCVAIHVNRNNGLKCFWSSEASQISLEINMTVYLINQGILEIEDTNLCSIDMGKVV